MTEQTQGTIIGEQKPVIAATAMWSLVLGILFLFLGAAGLVLGIPAIICGHVARKRIRASGSKLLGGGMATAGFVLGCVGTIISLCFLFFITGDDILRRNLSEAVSSMDSATRPAQTAPISSTP